jgi:hypothetical protein
MALTLPEAQAAFKKLGKLVFLSNMAPTDITDLKKASMGLVDQTNAGLAADFDTNIKVVQPVVATVQNLLSSIGTLPAQVKSAVNTFLTQILWVGEMDQAGSPASIAALGTELVSQMTAVGAHVAVAGVFYTYFNTNFGIALPTDAAPSIPDSWVDDDVIA